MVYEKNIYYAECAAEERGIEKGDERTAQLYVKLIDDERFEDARRANEDSDYRKKLMKEYGIE